MAGNGIFPTDNGKKNGRAMKAETITARKEKGSTAANDKSREKYIFFGSGEPVPGERRLILTVASCFFLFPEKTMQPDGRS
jgi:hypothetical protein